MVLEGGRRHCGIEKRELNVRPAWQIGEHDPDRVGIKDDDDVIRPEGFAVVPVLGVRESKRKQRKGERSEYRRFSTGNEVTEANRQK